MHRQSAAGYYQKKKRSTSGSRSRSKKPLGKQDLFTVELKPTISMHKSTNHHNHQHQHMMFQNPDISSKVKTQNSLSMGKSSKGGGTAKKASSKSVKKVSVHNYNTQHQQHQYRNTHDNRHQQHKYKQLITFRASTKQSKQSKDDSYMTSVERKHSLGGGKISTNKTQSTQQHVDCEQLIYKKLFLLKKQISKLQIPKKGSTSQISQYFNKIQATFSSISMVKPLQTILNVLHQMYLSPLKEIFELLQPYEEQFRQKEEIKRMMQKQEKQNQELFIKLSPQDKEILRLKEQIERNGAFIEQSINRSNKKHQYRVGPDYTLNRGRDHMHQKQQYMYQPGVNSNQNTNHRSPSKLKQLQQETMRLKRQQIQKRLAAEYTNSKKSRFDDLMAQQQKQQRQQQQRQRGQQNQQKNTTAGRGFNATPTQAIQTDSGFYKHKRSHFVDNSIAVAVSNEQQLQRHQQQQQQQSSHSKRQDKTLFQPQPHSYRPQQQAHHDNNFNEYLIHQQQQQQQQSSQQQRHGHDQQEQLHQNQNSNENPIYQKPTVGKMSGTGFNFKLDIPKIQKSTIGFHEEFLSNLDEFSQSWRNQALREKRY